MPVLPNIRNALFQLTATAVLLLVFSIPAWAQSVPEQDQEQALKEAVHRILIRGDMADVESLAKDTGMELHLLPINSNAENAIITKNPDYTYASSLAYRIEFDNDWKTTTVKLKFVPVSCPHIDSWETEWQQHEPFTILSEDIIWRFFDWNDNPDIHVELLCKESNENRLTITQTYHKRVDMALILETSGGSCLYNGRLPMSVEDILDAPSLTNIAPPAKDYARELTSKLVDLVEAGDIRDYSTLGKIFDTNFVAVPETTNAALLVNGSAHLAHAIPGLNGTTFFYHVNDTSWDVMPKRVVDPKYLHSRVASFGADIDRDLLCLNPEAFENMAQGRGLKIQWMKGSIYGEEYSFMNERNRLNVSFKSRNGCATSFKVEQITDAAYDLSGPLFLPPNLPSDRHRVGLNEVTKHTLDEVVRRLGAQKYFVVDIGIAQEDNTSAAEHATISKLSKLVRSYLIAKHVSSDRIVVHNVNRMTSRFLLFKAPGIYIDPSAQSYDLLRNPLPPD
jgi:hypothetical protein